MAFRNDTVLNETLNKIAKMSIVEYNEWINNIGFVSLQSIYHAIIIAEDNYDNRLEKNLESLHDYNGIRHSSLYMKYLREGLIREIYDKQVNSEYYELNTSLPWLSSILNKDGIFMVGKFVYQSSPDFLKIWENGDVNSLERFKQINQETGDIKFVIKNQSQSQKSTFDPNPATSGWAYKGDDRRIRINVYFETW
jgi:hypothetical protein